MNFLKPLTTTFLISIASLHTVYAHEESQSAKVDMLLTTQKAWDGTHYKQYPKGKPELSVLKFHLSPNSDLPWHTHPYPNAGYVLQGTLTIENKSGVKKTFKQGKAFAESVNDVHRGVTGPDGATLIVVYSGVHGISQSKPEPGEKPEF